MISLVCLPVAKAVSSKGRGAVGGGIYLERRQMTRAGTRRREEPPAAKASGTTGSAGVEVKEPEGLKGEQAEGIGEKRLRCGACGPASADGFAVLQSSFAKRCLRLEVCFGVFLSPGGFSLLWFLW